MKNSLDKYKFFKFKNSNGGTTVAAVSTYGGKTVKGYAKCNPEDEFDYEIGKELAVARCNVKIAHKKRMKATQKYLEASAAAQEAKRRFDKMFRYFIDSEDQYDEAAAHLREVIEKIKETATSK